MNDSMIHPDDKNEGDEVKEPVEDAKGLMKDDPRLDSSKADHDDKKKDPADSD